MKCTAIQEQMLSAVLDGRADSLPAQLKTHLETCEGCRKEWGRLNGWVGVLQDNNPWEPQGNFMEVLVERSMREKRRAELTESTSRELHLGGESWFEWLCWTPMFSRSGLATVFSLLLLTPVLYFGWNYWNHVGHFEYLQGNVIVLDNTAHVINEEAPVMRGTAVQTTQESNCIVRLEKGTELTIASLSRVVIEDERNIRVERGKAYFDITPGRGEFTVSLPEGTVQVLGTSFEVSVEEGQSRVTVTRGLVKLLSGRESAEVEPGSAGTLRLAVAPGVQPVASMAPVLRWVNRIREQKDRHDLLKYYPSLASPEVPKGGS